MSRPEVHEINGTTFRFPELPPRKDVDPELFRDLVAKRKGILAKALDPRIPVRNAGTVRAVLGKLGSHRREVVRPEHMRGEILIGGRTLHYWAATPVRGEYWFVDVEARRYVRVIDRDEYHESMRVRES